MLQVFIYTDICSVRRKPYMDKGSVWHLYWWYIKLGHPAV